jgi:hypothetical protein
MRNDTKASFLDKTEGARLCSAQSCCAVEDCLEYGLQVVRRAGDGAQHFRDSHPLCSEFSYLLL